MTAIYLAEIAPARIREIVKPLVEFAAALASISGDRLFWMVVTAPFRGDHYYALFAIGIVLLSSPFQPGSRLHCLCEAPAGGAATL